MADLSILYDNAQQALDVAVASQIEKMKQQGKLNEYLANNSSALINDITNTKDANAAKVFGDLGRSIDTQRNTYYYYQRNKDLLNVTDMPLKHMERDADNIKFDSENAQRQYEINQWASGNRADTLFVYQIIFISILILAIFTGLWRSGFVSTGFLSLLTFMLVAVIVLVIVYRAQYTIFRRNQRYWNKATFPKFKGPVFTPPDCAAISNVVGDLPDAATAAAADFQKSVRGGLASGLGSLGAALQNASTSVKV
jgi:hypothetical protein